MKVDVDDCVIGRISHFPQRLTTGDDAGGGDRHIDLTEVLKRGLRSEAHI